MDSMRSLDTSLPRSPRRRRSNPPPEQLLQSFKSAALSVTNLYKTAAENQSKARAAGYQDALGDLLALLDKKNLGLDDGEGWTIRQWATERLDSSVLTCAASDSDDEVEDNTKQARSVSPQKTTNHEAETQQAPQSTSPTMAISTPMGPPPPPPPQNNVVLRSSECFTFQSPHPYPSEIDMQTSEIQANTLQTIESQSQNTSPGPAVRVEIVPKGSRTNNRATRNNGRNTTSSRQLGAGAGTKRSLRFENYFDLGSLSDGKEGMGGGKRSRLI